MFGKNNIEKLEHGSAGNHLRIVARSPFLTIQGEGPYAGTAAIFLRLHGCHLRCTFCDTMFDNPNDPSLDINEIRQKIEHCGRVSDNRPAIKSVVITGGEPMRQNILPLCAMLNMSGYRIQIETAGTFWIPGIQNCAQIVCSPKTPTINEKIYEHAMAFKYVIRATDTFDGFLPITSTQKGTRQARLAAPRPRAKIYLSPCNEYDEQKNTANLIMVGALAIKYNVNAGVQMHNYLKLP